MPERDKEWGGGSGVTSFSMFEAEEHFRGGSRSSLEAADSAGKIDQRCRNTSEVDAHSSRQQQQTPIVQLEASAWCAAVTCPPTQVAKTE